MANDRLPVIVGVGEVADHVRDPLLGKEPLELMALALSRAEEDAGARPQALVSAIDYLDVVAEFSWPYEDPVGQLAGRIAAAPKHAAYGETGGETPLRYLSSAAIRVAEGDCELAAIVGAEATYTVAMAQKKGIELPWTPCMRDVGPHNPANAVARRYGVGVPTNVYPFYENAAQACWGHTPREGLDESGEIWSRMSSIASSNPYAWNRRQYGPNEITRPCEGNRLVAWPYTKRMVANPMVNQGAAVLVASAGYAESLGIPHDRMIYIKAGATAFENEDFLLRDQYCRSHAQDVVLDRALELADGCAEAFDLVELYSCFPCVPEMARRRLGLPADRALTVAGGLSFFGAPLNNYMSHATAACVRKLRDGRNSMALLYGQGGYVTKHNILILTSTPHMGGEPELRDLSVQAASRNDRVPPLVEAYDGPATLETFTVLYERSGEPKHGVVVTLTPDGYRVMAEVPADDTWTLELLTGLDKSPIGRQGKISQSQSRSQCCWFPVD